MHQGLIKIHITGEPGVGKTTLAAMIQDFLVRQGMREMNVRVEEGEGDVARPWHRDGRCMQDLVDKQIEVVVTTQQIRTDWRRE